MRYAAGRWADGRWDRESGRMFIVAGRSGSAGVAGHLWNPSSSRSLWVAEFSIGHTLDALSLDTMRLCRTTTVGVTPTATVTPNLNSDFAREVTPNTGAVLHLGGFGTNPVIASPQLFELAFPVTGTVNSLTWLFPEGIRIPPDTGLGLTQTAVVSIRAADLTFRFRE